MRIELLSDQQKEAATRLSSGRGIAWWKIGEGKTRLALYWASFHCPAPKDKTLVVCSPNAIRQWQDEAKLTDVNNLLFFSYGLLSRRRFTRFNPDIRCVIIDELWLYKNPKSIRTNNAARLVASLPALGLSGSLVTQGNIEDIYGQAKAVGLDKALASNLTEFRSQYMVCYSAFGGLQYSTKKHALPTIQQRLAPWVSIYFPPPEIKQKLLKQTVEPTDQQKRLLTDVNQEWFTILENGELEIKNAAVLIAKCQQISDGAVLDNEGNVSCCESNKLKRTLELCTELIDAEQRVVIWCAFKATVDLLADRFGKTATCLASHRKFDVEGWKNRKYQVCICTVGSGASINDFKDIQYCIVYSAPFIYRAVEQAFGRTTRKDSPHLIAYYYMMQTADTLDEYVYNSLRITQLTVDSVLKTSEQVAREYLTKSKK
jgi:hypothetical protein